MENFHFNKKERFAIRTPGFVISLKKNLNLRLNIMFLPLCTDFKAYKRKELEIYDFS